MFKHGSKNSGERSGSESSVSGGSMFQGLFGNVLPSFNNQILASVEEIDSIVGLPEKKHQNQPSQKQFVKKKGPNENNQI